MSIYNMSDFKNNCHSHLKNMGFTDEYLIISENMRGIDLTAYKEDEEYGLICKILEENMNLQSDSVESDLYVFIHALEHIGGYTTLSLLNIYLTCNGFVTNLVDKSDNIISGTINRGSKQYFIKYYCENGFSNVTPHNMIDYSDKYVKCCTNVEKIEINPGSYYFDNMDGHAFEKFCGEVLKKNGFEEIAVTKGTGDQGIDIICYKDSVKYGIQCKCYTSDIGNKAVQEVYAGKTYYQCHVGVVLTNRAFTKSAIDLAEKNGIILWDRNKLLSLTTV